MHAIHQLANLSFALNLIIIQLGFQSKSYNTIYIFFRSPGPLIRKNAVLWYYVTGQTSVSTQVS